MSIRMIATDMDGTLLDGLGQLDLPRLTTILDELDKRDIRFVVATGNEIGRMRNLFGPELAKLMAPEFSKGKTRLWSSIGIAIWSRMF